MSLQLRCRERLLKDISYLNINSIKSVNTRRVRDESMLGSIASVAWHPSFGIGSG
jgi:hypothetical protein